MTESMRPAERYNSRYVDVSNTLCLTLLFVSCQGHGGDFRGRVVVITDGDTISVMHSGKAEKIRLNGIDCPERGQPFGTRARKFTSTLAFGKEVMTRTATGELLQM